MTVIEFASKRLNEEGHHPDSNDALYWAAYLDGARAQKKEDDKDKKLLQKYKRIGTPEELKRACYDAYG